MDDVPKEILRAAYQRNPLYLLKIPFLYGLAAGAVGVLYAVHDTPYLIPVGIVCSILISYIIRGLGAIAHDAVHGTAAKSKFWSYVISLICWAPTAMSVTIYANYHLHHHRIANTYPDVDNFVVTDYTKNPLAAKLLLTVVYTFGYPIYFLTQMFRYMKRLSTAKKIQMHLELAGWWGLVALGAYYMPFWVFFFAYGVPFILSAALASITSMIEHFGMEPGDDAYGSRTYGTKAYVSNFLWNNVSFHTEHHKFPGIPWYNLRSFHEAAFPYYDERVQRECYPSVYRLAFSLYKRIWQLDIAAIDKKYAGLDREAERREKHALPGIPVESA